MGGGAVNLHRIIKQSAFSDNAIDAVRTLVSALLACVQTSAPSACRSRRLTPTGELTAGSR
jgi:hypothetical protein